MNYTSISRNNLLKLKSSIENSINDLNIKVKDLEENLQSVNNAIKHIDKEMSPSISIPSKLLHTSIENGSKQKYEWKRRVERCIKIQEIPISCRHIYNELKKGDDWLLVSDREALKNISSALSYLIRDGKVKKLKIENNAHYVYGNAFLHFDLNGNLRNKSDKNFVNNKIATE